MKEFSTLMPKLAKLSEGIEKNRAYADYLKKANANLSRRTDEAEASQYYANSKADKLSDENKKLKKELDEVERIIRQYPELMVQLEMQRDDAYRKNMQRGNER